MKNSEIHFNAPDNTEPIFNIRLGVRTYEICEGNKELLEEWTTEIEKIRDVVVERNFESLLQLIDTYSFRANTKGMEPEQAVEIIKSKEFSADSQIILAISLWVLSRKQKWKGDFAVLKRFAIGGRKKMSSFMDKDSEPNCLDSSVLIDYLAKKFGVDGSIKDT